MRLLEKLGLSLSDVERELDEEFEFHMRERADQLQAQGVGKDEAERRARESFGDLRRFRAEAAIAASPRVFRRRMWMIAAACSIGGGGVTLVMVGAVSIHYHTRVVARLRSDIEQLRADLAPFRGEGPAQLAQQVRFVTIRGAVKKPRVWTLPREVEVSLRTLIEKSGGLAPGARGDVVLTSNAGSGISKPRVLSEREWRASGTPEVPINGFMTIEVR